METFWTEHGWAVPVWLLGVLAILALLLRARRRPCARTSRMILRLWPGLDPDRRAPAVRRWLMLLALGTLVLCLVWQP